jgi:predicted deacylase
MAAGAILAASVLAQGQPRTVSIGTYSDGAAMTVTAYGSGTERALFLLGGLHGNEAGGKYAVTVMETAVRRQQGGQVFFETTVFVLNPASRSVARDIAGIDPNRDFISQALPETRAIAAFTQTLAADYPQVLIISAHQYNDARRGAPGAGFVFPLYLLTGPGKRKIAGLPGTATVSMTPQADYVTPAASAAAALAFAEATGFVLEPLWQNEMYPGEYMHFVSALGRVSMIEFEVPQSDADKGTLAKWDAGFTRFMGAVYRSFLTQNGQF